MHKMKTNKTKRASRNGFKRRSLKRKQRGGKTRTLEDASIVEGTIKHGKVIGRGTRTFTDGSVYEGHFDGFIPHGKGKLTLSYGYVYEGQFSGGGMKRGVMTDPNGNVTKCDFIMVQNEHGILVALANGMGELTYAATGTVYRGEFRNGMLNGHGTLTMTDGSVFEGEFQNGLADGLGRLTHADGTFEEGLFRHINGELVHLDMPSLELDLELNPGPWNPKLKTRYNAERAIAERPSGAQ